MSSSSHHHRLQVAGERPVSVGVLGGGLSGLSAAYFARERFGPDARITVVEASPRAGGWLMSIQKDGFMFERGCRGFRPTGNGSNALTLMEELGLVDQVVLSDPAANRKYLFLDGKLTPVPTSATEAFGSPVMRGLLPAMWNDVWSKTSRPASQDDESLHAFISRRFSPRLAARLIDPMISGIYAGDIRQLSARAVFGRLVELEEQHGSVIAGALRESLFSGSKTSADTLAEDDPSPFVQSARKAASVSFVNGIETMPATLLSVLEAQPTTEVRFEERVTGISKLAEGSQVSVSTDKDTYSFDYVVSALSAKALDPCMSLPEVSEVASMPYASVAVINLGWKSDVLSKRGFGYLVPSSENQGVLGVVFDSCTFPTQGQPGHTRLSVMAGGAHNPAIVDATTSELEDLALEKVSAHLGISADPDVVVAGVHKHAIPQYPVGHVGRVASANDAICGAFGGRVTICGNSFSGIGASDCVANAKAAVEKL